MRVKGEPGPGGSWRIKGQPCSQQYHGPTNFHSAEGEEVLKDGRRAATRKLQDAGKEIELDICSSSNDSADDAETMQMMQFADGWVRLQGSSGDRVKRGYNGSGSSAGSYTQQPGSGRRVRRFWSSEREGGRKKERKRKEEKKGLRDSNTRSVWSGGMRPARKLGTHNLQSAVIGPPDIKLSDSKFRWRKPESHQRCLQQQQQQQQSVALELCRVQRIVTVTGRLGGGSLPSSSSSPS